MHRRRSTWTSPIRSCCWQRVTTSPPRRRATAQPCGCPAAPLSYWPDGRGGSTPEQEHHDDDDQDEEDDASADVDARGQQAQHAPPHTRMGGPRNRSVTERVDQLGLVHRRPTVDVELAGPTEELGL